MCLRGFDSITNGTMRWNLLQPVNSCFEVKQVSTHTQADEQKQFSSDYLDNQEISRFTIQVNHEWYDVLELAATSSFMPRSGLVYAKQSRFTT